MINAIRYELTRLATVRSTWVLLCTGLGLQAAVAYVYASKTDLTAREQFVYSFTGLSLTLVTLCITAVAVNALGHEFRYGTVATTVLVLRDRGRVLAAKALTAAGVAACASLALVGVTLLVQLLVSAVPSEAWRVAQVTGAVAVYAVLAALAGLGLVAVTGNATLSMVAVLAVPSVVEIAGMLAGIDPSLLPFHAAAQLVTPSEGNPVLMVLPLLLLATGLLGVGAALFARRDL
ncbi:ABC transporter permease [Nocardia otitidiscaviarum]|uniref:ABC transporter permease n=1 Tax=Nocardia otitidiscaviarum TaxID=1823 RepID=UPI00163DB8F0|nr:ABC transporter permease [Nocardia otitidiscaviarum]MCP9620359.1 ABC transporter permease [Nocardia otitidiscaviarum]